MTWIVKRKSGSWGKKGKLLIAFSLLARRFRRHFISCCCDRQFAKHEKARKFTLLWILVFSLSRLTTCEFLFSINFVFFIFLVEPWNSNLEKGRKTDAEGKERKSFELSWGTIKIASSLASSVSTTSSLARLLMKHHQQWLFQVFDHSLAVSRVQRFFFGFFQMWKH